MGDACDYCHYEHPRYVTPDKCQRFLLNLMCPWSLLACTALNESKVIKYINYYSDLLGCCWQSWYIFSPLLSWFCGEGRTSGSALATCSSFYWSGSDWSYQHHWDAGSGSQFKAGSQCRSCATSDLAADASISTSWLDHGEMAFGALLEQEVEVLRRRLGWTCSSEPWIWHMMSEEGSHVWSLRRPGCCFQALKVPGGFHIASKMSLQNASLFEKHKVTRIRCL